MAAVLSVLASVLMVLVSVAYLRQVNRGVSTTSPTTWAILLVAMAFSLPAYWQISHGNGWKMAMPVVIALGVLLTFVYTLVKFRFSKVGWVDYLTLIGAGVAGVWWYQAGSADTANILMQGILFFSFTPIVVGVHTGKLREGLLSWGLGVAANVLFFFSLLMSPDWRWVQFANPVCGILANGAVVLAVLYRGELLEPSVSEP